MTQTVVTQPRCVQCQVRVQEKTGGTCRRCRYGRPIPPPRRHCDRCGAELPRQSREKKCKACLIALRLRASGQSAADSALLRADLAWELSGQSGSGPTSALPGSIQRLAVLIARQQEGQPLWDDRDVPPDLS